VSGVEALGRAALLAVASSIAAASPAPAGAAAVARHSAHVADSARLALGPARGPVRAPSQPPLTAGGASRAEGTAESSAGASGEVESDPLVSNGLGSPSCRGAMGMGALSPARARNCSTSGFSAAGAPTGNYGLDVHIDTGLLGLSDGGLLSIVQDLFVAPVWMALVWSVHALVVMLEWCFAIDLLDSPASGGVGRGLREMQASFTDPWLASVLAVAAVVAIYNGVIRRRVADTLGQAAAMAAMMVGGMWLIADPTGTVGAVGAWANQASLGTLALSARSAAPGTARALPDSMAALFSSAIEVPWCYLEFGDVGWCRSMTRLDPRLRQVALRIASAELAAIGCRSSGGLLPMCVPAGSAHAAALERDATLLREADTNGAIFLALPANGPARNSINDPNSLLRAICGTSEATHCGGPAAAQAQFRTNSGTWPRVGGLVLIFAGLLGVLLLFGFIALRLLGAALLSLIYLLLAPAAVLAPAFGEAGRSVFRRWATQLLAAVVSKLLFSFLLGAVLAVLSILASLEGLGWWTQWLLMSAFWWGAFARRHQALAVLDGSSSSQHAVRRPRGWHAPRRPGAVKAITGQAGAGRLGAPGALRRLASGARGRFSAARADTPGTGRRRPAAGAAPSTATDEQAMRLLASERRDATRRSGAPRDLEAGLAAKHGQLARTQAAHRRASVAGNTRRAAELGARARRVTGEIEQHQQRLAEARRLGESSGGQSGGERAADAEHARQRSAFLDAQLRLPGSLQRARAQGEGRDYPRLAPLIGVNRGAYERLGPGAQRAARLEIDRELTLRRPLGGVMDKPLRTPRARASSAEQRTAAVEARRDHAQPVAIRHRVRPTASRTDTGEESSVMRDARAVAARRKRQLGVNRP
jgi:hypothetical protein